MFDSPEFPDYSQNTDGIILLFPSKDSIFIEELDFRSVNKLLVIDSTWQQTRRILSDPKLKGIQRVKIRAQKTNFWRYQNKGQDHLSTIEAIYYFYREFQSVVYGSYSGEYDNLLYYYSYFYEMIQSIYKKNKKKFKHIDGYVVVD